MKRSLIILPLLVLLPLTACGDDTEKSAEDGSTATSRSEGYPFTVDNCGTEVTFEAAPERIVTIKSTSVELALALGQRNKIVGTAFNDGPIVDPNTGQEVTLPVISDQAPNQEATLAEEPDLVFAGWESNLAADTAGERDTLAKLGVDSYVSPAACQEPEYQPNPMTYDKLFDEFQTAGRIFDATQAADELVARQRAELAEVTKAVPGTTALWWSSGEDTPFVGAGIGAPQMVMDAVGLENIAKDVQNTWTSMGWEPIVAADPDVIVLVDAAWNTASDKIKALESNKATANLSAVRHKRYLVIPFPAAEAGVRSVSAATTLSSGLADLGLVGS